MAMSTQQVMELANKLNESKNEVIPETEVKDEVQPEVVETNDTTPENENVSDDTPAQETVVESENKPVKPSKKEQEQYAFAKLKNKERQKREKLEARIKELEEINKKYAGLNLESFQNDQSKYTEYLVGQKMNDIEKQKLLEEKRQSQMAEYDAINEQRIMNCFPDEKERTIYNKLIDEHASDFVKLLDKADPEGVILGYLDDSEISPLLIRILMTKPEYRNEILSKTNPYTKMMAMKSFEDKVSNAVKIVSRNQAKQTKKSIPVVGSVTKSETSNTQLDKNDPSYWNNKLHELNQLRGRR